MAESHTHLDENQTHASMEDFNGMRAMITGAVLCFSTVFAASIWVFTEPILHGAANFVAVAIFLLLFGSFLIQGIAEIDPTKNEVAIPIVGKKFVNRLMGPGYIFVPLRGWFLDFMLETGMNLSNRSKLVIMLPDDKEIEEPITTNFMIDPYNPAPFIRLGQTLEARLAEIDKRFDEQIGQHLRQWHCSTTEGPQTMEQARQMKDEEILAILEKVAGNDVKRLHPDLTNPEIVGIYKKYPWLEAESEVKRKFHAIPKPEQDKLMKGAKGLLKLVNASRNGQYQFKLVALGVIVTKLVIGNTEPTEETRKGMLSVSQADWDAQAQAKTSASVAAEAKLYAAASPIPIDAVKTALIRRTIVKEDIKVTEVKFSPNVTDTVMALGTQLMDKVFAKSGDGKDNGNGSNNAGAGTAKNPAKP